jgi:hypothetical protein
VLDAVLRHYRVERKNNPEWFEGDDDVQSLDDLLPMLSCSGLRVRTDAANGRSLLGFSFHCDWEPEHGLGVCTHGMNVLDVGDWECGENGPAMGASSWLLEAATPEERRYSERVGREILAAPTGAGAGPMPPVVEWMVAAASGDAGRAAELLESAVEGTPQALFTAIDMGNAALVRKLVAKGAPTGERLQGQTPLAHAREQLKNYSEAFELQTRELAALKRMADAPEGTPPEPGSLMSAVAAFRAMASQLAGPTEGEDEGTPPAGLSKDVIADRVRYYEQLVANSRQAEANLRQIVSLLESAAGQRP